MMADWCDSGMHSESNHEILVQIDLHQRTIPEGVRDCLAEAEALIKTLPEGPLRWDLRSQAHQVQSVIESTEDDEGLWDENAALVDSLVEKAGLIPLIYDGTWFVLAPEGEEGG